MNAKRRDGVESHNHGSSANPDSSKHSTRQDGSQISIFRDQHDASAELKDHGEDPEALPAAEEEHGAVSEQ